MEKRLPIAMIITVITGLVAIACLVQVLELREQVQRLQRSVEETQQEVRDTVSSQYSQISSMLEEEGSLLAGSSFSYGALDLETMTVEFCYQVTPKTFTPGETTAAVVINGTQYPMTLEDGSFVCRIAWPLTDQIEVSQILFWTDGVQQAEAVNHVSMLQVEALPSLYPWFEGNVEGETSLRVAGYLTVETAAPAGQTLAFSSIDLVAYADGEEIHRETFAGEEIYHDSTAYSASQDLERTYEVPEGATFELCVEMVDESGLRYKAPVVRRGVNYDTGENVVEEISPGFYEVYDPDGKLLFRN
jgi:hypothetical protein